MILKNFYPTAAAVIQSLTAFPICYIYNSKSIIFGNFGKFIFAAVIVLVDYLMIYWVAKNLKNKFFYVFSLFIWSAVIDLIIALDLDGFIFGFMKAYISYNEPYLACPFGAVTCYYDAVVNLSLYSIMCYYSSNGLSYRSVGLFYSGNMFFNVFCYMVGASVSESGYTWCTLLNVPYILFPLAVCFACFKEEKQKSAKTHPGHVDTALAVLLLMSCVACVIRGMAALGGNDLIPATYRDYVEPAIYQEDPAPYVRVHCYGILFYLMPAFLALAGGLVSNPSQDWLHDLSLLMAGASFYVGVLLVSISYHPLTELEHRPPSMDNIWAFVAYWLTNILISVVPQLVLLRLHHIRKVISRRGTFVNGFPKIISDKKGK